MSSAVDLKSTLNLPQTAFPMKANLPQTEPQRLQQWKETVSLPPVRESRRGAPPFVLHDGPPYANGRDPHRDRAQQGPQGLRRAQPAHGRPRRALRAGLGLPRPSHRAAGRPRPRREEEGDERGGVPPRLPRLRGEVRRHPARRVRAAGRPGRVERALPDHGPVVPGHHRARSSPSSWRRASSTRPRSRCTGASTTAPRWPRPRSSTTRTTTSPSIDVRFRLAEGERERLGAARRRTAVYAVIWTTTPWTLPANLALAFHPDADYGLYETDGGALLLATALKDAAAARWHKSGQAQPASLLAHRQGRGARRRALPPSLDRPRLAWRAGRLRHARHRHGRGAHGPGPRLGRLPDGRALRARDLLPRGRARALHHRGGGLRRTEGVRRQPGHRRPFCASGARCWPRAASGTRTPSAGAARRRSSSGPRSSGSSLSTSRARSAAGRCARRPCAPSPTSAGTRAGASSASTTWWPRAPTGASRASGCGACPSRPSTARAAGRPCCAPTWRGGWRTCSSSRARTPGTSGRRGSCCRRDSRVQAAVRPSSRRRRTSWTCGSTPAPRTRRCSATGPTCPGRPTCTWKAATSIADGSTPRCCCPWPRAAARPTSR